MVSTVAASRGRKICDLAPHHGAAFGIVHCDVSPHNLFVTYGGEVKIVDFGFAQSRDSDTAFDVAGRSAYLAPEVLAGDPFDGRADVFSLGVVLWELIARVRLFKRIVRMALERDPAQRYESAGAMRDALLAFLADQSALLEQNAVAAFMTDLFGAKSRDVVLARERAEARQSQAHSEPPTLLRTPPPIEDEMPAEELLRTPRRSTITPKPPRSAARPQDLTQPSPESLPSLHRSRRRPSA